jgi:hypothetical protein
MCRVAFHACLGHCHNSHGMPCVNTRSYTMPCQITVACNLWLHLPADTQQLVNG